LKPEDYYRYEGEGRKKKKVALSRQEKTSCSSYHPGGVNAAFADGSVHFIKSSISSWNSLAMQRIKASPVGWPGTTPNCTIPAGVTPGVWQALCTINGGEVISSDQY
jgi:prepilin-type processing-associated H-X9-DG protein